VRGALLVLGAFGFVAAQAQVIELSSLDGTYGLRLEGVNGDDQAGVSVGFAGDVNGDGIDDVIVGARNADPNGQNSGAAYVVFGSDQGFPALFELSSLDGTNGFTLNGANPFDQAGIVVNGIGDINGDTFDDVVVGADRAGFAGECYVVFGKANWSGTPVVELSSLNGTNGFLLRGAVADDEVCNENAAAGAGDVNDDGIDDLIVGAPSQQPTTAPGKAHVVFGSDGTFPAIFELSSLNGTNGFTLNGINEEEGAGFAADGAGDINDDGIDDVIIGALRADPNGTNSGVVYVVFGSDQGFPAVLELSSLDGTNGFTLNGSDPGDTAGYPVKGAGDVNADGIDDVIIGASSADPNNVRDAGKGYVVFGKADWSTTPVVELSLLDGTNGFALNGIAQDDRAGSSVNGIGDVNVDGFEDIIITSSGARPNGFASGQSYVVFGTDQGFSSVIELSSLNGTNGFMLNGSEVGDGSGVATDGGGDFNGDGRADFIIGAYGTGRVYIIFGVVVRYVALTGSDIENACRDVLNPCATLARAVNQANDGDIIDLAAGTYNEPGLVIEKNLFIRGQGVVVQ